MAIPLPSDDASLRTALQTLVLAMIVAAGAGLAATRMTVDVLSFAPLLGAVAALALARPLVVRFATPRLAAAFDLTALLLGALVPVLILSFAAMRGGGALADDMLARADAALSLDPLAFARAVDRVPALATALGFAYSSFALQVGLLPILLALAERTARAYRFALAFLILTTVASAIASFFPALGTMAHAGIGPHSFAHIDATFGYHFLDSFAAVRSAPPFELSAQRAAGILTFPSVHAGVAVLCAWAGWSLATRWLWVVLNAAMVVSAVTHGAHYVVDVIAGGALAVAVVALVSVLGRQSIEPHRAVVRDGRQPRGRAIPG